jgi:hypothetical protein
VVDVVKGVYGKSLLIAFKFCFIDFLKTIKSGTCYGRAIVREV